MIVIGSYAAQLNGIKMRDKIRDVDVYGTDAELKKFRSENAEFIVSEVTIFGRRTHFTLKGAGTILRAEFGIASKSDRMLERLSAGRTGSVLNSTMYYPNPNLLYLIKRSHGFGLAKFEKTSRDLIALRRHITPFTADELAFLAARTQETEERLRDHRKRYRVPLTDDLVPTRGPVPVYEHTEVLKVVAFEPGAPVRARLDASWRNRWIDPAEFASLSPDDQLKLMQEEVMANTIERFHLLRPQFPATRVYPPALFKTARDLIPRPLQEFYLDHLEQLIVLPPVPFLDRFRNAVAAGNLRPVAKPLAPGPKHQEMWDVLAKGDTLEVLGRAEDMIRFSEMPGDPFALHILGKTRLERGEIDAAERALRKSLSLLPGNLACAADLAALARAKAAPSKAVPSEVEAEE